MSKQFEVAAVAAIPSENRVHGSMLGQENTMPRLLLAKGDAHGYCFIERYKQASFNR